MAIYYFTISALTGLGFALTEKKKETRKTVVYLCMAFLVLAFIASFRYAIGFDYFSYQMIYEMVSAWNFGDILHYYWYEPLFFMACKGFSLIGCPYPVFLIFLNLFLLFAAMWFIYQNSKLPWMSVYLFITLQFLAYNMNLLRQSAAVAFFMLAYPYLKNRKIVPYTLLIIVGGLFHNSLWFVYPLYFLLPKKHSRKFLLCLSALAVAGYLLFDPLFQFFLPIMPQKYAGYQYSYFWNANAFDYTVPSALYALLVYLFRNRIKDTGLRTIYLNSALYNFLASLFITKHFILERFAIYPFVFSLLAVPEIVSSYRDEKSKGEKHLFAYRHVLVLFLVFGGVYFLFAAQKGFHHVYPYVSLLDKSCSVPNEM